ncbi:polysialyltransferase family glycosyltransferase [Dasania marina]|uniref:polysialyltransferase family glycosyltransferase n=1 Tax=Dasania marina TaxID=471499 RepID=UPI0030DD9EC5|tara:strand:- start:58482 stop:59528 length:1047 start_codon:yes stop_codon:yes gene_type:complete
MPQIESDVVRLFFVKTQLERVVADMIASSYTDGSSCFLFAYKEVLLDDFLWEGWREKQYLNLKQKKGIFSGQRTAIKHLESIEKVVLSVCVSAKSIEINLSRLKNNNSNYVIERLKSRFSHAEVKVNIVPHGSSSFYRGQLSEKEVKKMRNKNNFLMRSLFPLLKYFAFKGERYGADEPVVQTIYTFPGHVLDHPKAKAIEFDHFDKIQLGSDLKNDILIVGQPVYMRERLSPDQVARIDNRISQLIKEVGAGDVYFLPHPREDGSMCFFQEGFKLIEYKEPLELLLLKRTFKTVISSFSTGLFTSKMILGEACNSYAVGMNLINVPDDELQQLRQGFQSVGVELIDV